MGILSSTIDFSQVVMLFTLIPFSATLEIMSVFLLGLVVIIPTVMGGWNEFSNDRMIELLKAASLGGDDSTDDGSSNLLDNEDVFIHLNRFLKLAPVFFLCALSITIMI